MTAGETSLHATVGEIWPAPVRETIATSPDLPLVLCDLAQAYHPGSGGIRTYLHAKRRHIVSRTPHRHVLVVPGERDEVESNGRSITYRVASPRIPGCAPYRFPLRAGAILSILREECPHVVEVDTPYVLPWAAFRYRRESGCAVTGFYHTDVPAAYATAVGRRLPLRRGALLARRLASGYVAAVHRRFDLSLTASRRLHRKLEAMGATRILPVRLGVNPLVFHPRHRSQELRRSLGVERDEILLVYAGRLDSEKRIEVLLDAIRHLPLGFPGRLAIAGAGPWRRRVAARAREDSRIVLLPWQMDRGGLARLLASADLYVTAAPHETFGLSVLEAQSSGLAVVGVHAGAMLERVDEGTGRLVPPGDARGFARAIVQVLGNGFREMGIRARDRVEAEYDWSRSLDHLLTAYSELAARRAASA